MTGNGTRRPLRTLVSSKLFGRRSALALGLRAGMATRQGPSRRVNEDVCLLDPDRGLFAVADGMGGHPAGDVAARVAIAWLPELMDRELAKVRRLAPADAVSRAISQAMVGTSDAVHAEAATSAELNGMGTTLVLVLVRGDDAYIAHVGDSRAYLLRAAQLRRLTEDDSLLTALLRRGADPDEAERHPLARRLMQGIGTSGHVRPTVSRLGMAPGDRLLLCSDGLTGVLGESELGPLLGRDDDAQAECDLLVQTAGTAGTRDDTSVIVVDLPESHS